MKPPDTLDPTDLQPLVPEAVAFLRRLVLENSYTLNREGVNRNGDLVAAQFAALGFTPERVPAENSLYGDHLFLTRPAARGPSVLLVSHLDTVFPAEEEEKNDFHWREEGEFIYGPGIMDIKGGTAMIWLVLQALQAKVPERFAQINWIVALNAAEEVLVKDFAERCRERCGADCRGAIVFESCGGKQEQHIITDSRKGMADVLISVEGRGGHAGAEHQHGANAIVAVCHLVNRMAAMTDYGRGVTLSVGRINGGGLANRIPHEASCIVNVRGEDEASLQEALDAVQRFAEEEPFVRAASDGYPCRTRVEILGRHVTWPRNPATARLVDFWLRAAVRLGIPLDARRGGGVSDANFLSAFLPALDGVGPHGANSHSSERSADGVKVPEYILPASFATMGAINAVALLDLLATGPGEEMR